MIISFFHSLYVSDVFVKFLSIFSDSENLEEKDEYYLGTILSRHNW